MASYKPKRILNFLSIEKKVEMLKRVDGGLTAKRVCELYDVGLSTVYDLIKQKDKLYKAYEESDCKNQMKFRKTLYKPRSGDDFDKVLMEWFKLRRSEGMPITGQILKLQARKYHTDMNIQMPMTFSNGWLRSFIQRHGIKYLKISGEQGSADMMSAVEFILEFEDFITDNGLSPEQIFNADETALFWRYVPRNTYASWDENMSGFKDNKQRLTILGTSNYAGTAKLKLAVIGTAKRPRCFPQVHTLPVHWYSNKRAWMTTQIFNDWYKRHFLPEARAHCTRVGLDENCLIVLVLDNCTAHPPAEELNTAHINVKYLPPNCTSLIQPQDQGILRSMKCLYKNLFLNAMLDAVNRGVPLQDFLKSWNVKDAVYAINSAWAEVSESTLKNGWHKLCPPTIAGDNEEDELVSENTVIPVEESRVLENIRQYIANAPTSCFQEEELNEFSTAMLMSL